MPSGWTTNGIDWSSALNMRKSRTEDIIRELYKATHERDFWVRRWATKSTDNYSTVFPTIPTQRIENQIDFIYTTLQNWLTTDSNPVISTTYVENKAVWIDENQIPTGSDLTNTVNLGIPHWDMSENGNLETELSIDLSFLRDYTTPIKSRISLNDMKKVYDILNFLTKCRTYQVEYDNGIFTRSLQNLETSLFGSGVYVRGHISGVFANPDPVDTYNQWANSTPSIGFGPDPTVSYNQRTTSIPDYLLNSNEVYFQFTNMTGFDASNYEASDFTFEMLYLDLQTANTQNPLLNIVNGINAMGNIQESLGAKAFVYPNTDMQTFPSVPSSGSNVWRNTGYLMPFADMNKEGFLKYYTEPTN